MTWFIILYLIVFAVVIVLFIRALYRYLNLKESFRNKLPDIDKECVNGMRRYPIYYYNCDLLRKKIKDELARRYETLRKYDSEKAGQLIRAEKRMFAFLRAVSVCLIIGAYLLLVRRG